MSNTPTFLETVDARLGEMTDDGDKAVYLNSMMAQCERQREALHRWAHDPDEDAPSPVGNLSVFDIDSRIWGIQQRINALRAAVKARIAEAERVLS